MSLTLSSADLEQLRSITRLLAGHTTVAGSDQSLFISDEFPPMSQRRDRVGEPIRHLECAIRRRSEDSVPQRASALSVSLRHAYATAGGANRKPSEWRADLFRVIDATGVAALVWDSTERVVHRTPGFPELLRADPESDRLEETVAEVVRDSTCPRGVSCLVREAETAAARYVIRVCPYPAVGKDSSLVISAVHRVTPVSRGEANLRATYGLTLTEARVARKLAGGSSNAQLAKALIVSPHTARRHTERVLRKLNVRSRAEVVAKLLG